MEILNPIEKRYKKDFPLLFNQNSRQGVTMVEILSTTTTCPQNGGNQTQLLVKQIDKDRSTTQEHIHSIQHTANIQLFTFEMTDCCIILS